MSSYGHHYDTLSIFDLNVNKRTMIISTVFVFALLTHAASMIIDAMTSASSDDLSLEYYVLEEVPAGSVIGNLVADVGLSTRYSAAVLRTLRFTFLTQPPSHQQRPSPPSSSQQQKTLPNDVSGGPGAAADRMQYFVIDESNGDVIAARQIDREKVCPRRDDCVIMLDVAVQPIQFFQIIKVKVEIVDINDNSPLFPEPRVVHQISELAELGSSFVIPSATDLDSGSNAIKRYEILTPSSSQSSVLPLSSSLFGTEDIVQGVQGVGEGGDKFDLSARTTADGGTDLRLILRERLDREEKEMFTLTVLAIDGGEPARTGSIQIDVIVLDANDNNPTFENTSYEVYVPEDVPVGTVIMKVKAKDRDAGVNAAIVYEFSKHTAQEYGHLFGIKAESGKVYLKHELDYESRTIYLLSVTAHDRGPDSLPAHTSLAVRVVDVNDNAPQISVNTLTSSTFAEVRENADVGTFVAHLSVVDADSADNGHVICSVDNNNFVLQQIYTSELKVVTASRLDRETIDSYLLSISCRDMGGGSSPGVGGVIGGGSGSHTSVLALSVRVSDENDNSPTFDRPVYAATISENSGDGGGSARRLSVVRVHAVDLDEGLNGEVRYGLDDDVAARLLSIDERTGDITCVGSFDHEVIKEIAVYINAIDRGHPPRSSSARLKLTILDVDDNIPKFTRDSFSFHVLENEQPGTEVGVVTAEDKDSPPFNQFIFTLLIPRSASSTPDRNWAGLFDLDPVTGRIRARETLDREHQPSYTLTVGVRSVGGGLGGEGEEEVSYSDTCTVTIHVIDVNDHAPSFTYPPSQGNETITVSSETPRGHVIARLKAVDLDTGRNANLTYHVSMTTGGGGGRQNLFGVVTETGAVVVRGDLSAIDVETFILRLTVRDQASPPLSDSSLLRIIVRRDISFVLLVSERKQPEADRSSGSSLLASEDMVIVLAFTLATVLLAIVIIVTIICLFRQRQLQQLEQDGRRAGAVGAIGDCVNHRLATSGAITATGDFPEKKDVFRNDDMTGGGVIGYNHVTFKPPPFCDLTRNSYDMTLGWRCQQQQQRCKDDANALLGDGTELLLSNGFGPTLGNGRKATAVVNAFVSPHGSEKDTRRSLLNLGMVDCDDDAKCAGSTGKLLNVDQQDSMTRKPVVAFVKDQNEIVDGHQTTSSYDTLDSNHVLAGSACNLANQLKKPENRGAGGVYRTPPSTPQIFPPCSDCNPNLSFLANSSRSFLHTTPSSSAYQTLPTSRYRNTSKSGCITSDALDDMTSRCMTSRDNVSRDITPRNERNGRIPFCGDTDNYCRLPSRQGQGFGDLTLPRSRQASTGASPLAGAKPNYYDVSCRPDLLYGSDVTMASQTKS